MKIQGTMLMFVLAGCMCAVAQTSTSDSMSKSDNMNSDKKMNKNMGKEKSMTGCVSEQDGKYMLMTKDHPNGVMLMTSEDLKPHIGHKVKIKGTMASSDQMMGSHDNMASSSGMSGSGNGSMSDDKMKSNDKMKSDNGMGMTGVKVTEMKMVSDKCSMPKMSMNK